MSPKFSLLLLTLLLLLFGRMVHAEDNCPEAYYPSVLRVFCLQRG